MDTQSDTCHIDFPHWISITDLASEDTPFRLRVDAQTRSIMQEVRRAGFEYVAALDTNNLMFLYIVERVTSYVLAYHEINLHNEDNQQHALRVQFHDFVARNRVADLERAWTDSVHKEDAREHEQPHAYDTCHDDTAESILLQIDNVITVRDPDPNEVIRQVAELVDKYRRRDHD